MTEIILTHHAIDRAQERLGLSGRQLARLMSKIYQRGARREFLDTDLCRWFDAKLKHGHDAMRESVIHMGHMFVVERGILITLYDIPPGLHRQALAAARLNRESATS